MPRPLHPRLSLTAYVDCRLPAWRRVVVERHLVGCTRCAMEVARTQALRRLLASPEVPEVPPGLRDRLLGIGYDDPRERDRDVGHVADASDGGDGPGDTAGPSTSRPLTGAVGAVVAGLVVLGAAGAGAVVTGATTPGPGASPVASLSTMLPRLLPWPAEPGGAPAVQTVDNGDRP